MAKRCAQRHIGRLLLKKKKRSLFLAPPGFSCSLIDWRAGGPTSVQKVLGHLKAFRFSIVFNWYVYDQEEDKL